MHVISQRPVEEANIILISLLSLLPLSLNLFATFVEHPSRREASQHGAARDGRREQGARAPALLNRGDQRHLFDTDA
jgi:hypothetical protein